MAKSQDAKKTVKKEPLKTAKEKKEEKREKKNNPKRDQFASPVRPSVSGAGHRLQVTEKKQFKNEMNHL